jgi:Late competence development protein ComFB
MLKEFESVHNYFEQAVFRKVSDSVALFPDFADNAEMLADVACVALNRLPPKYIRNQVDMNFFMDNDARAKNEAAVNVAVNFAFRFVQSRAAKRSTG